MADAMDMELVREYAQRNAEPAFAELVRRHVNLVYSVALRFTGNSDDAQDVTQAVFILLAQKAAGLRRGTILTGWLYETTRFTGMKCLRTKLRQQAREEEAFMQSTLNEATPDHAWKQLAPLLEEAMAQLSEKERTLLALRFFENKTGAETAALLGIQEWAAHKRVQRAVEKLRGFFVRRGAVLTAGVLTEAISANSVQAAPATLAKTATAVAFTKGATASGSTLTLLKGALKIMAWTKEKMAIVAVAGLVLATSVSVVVIVNKKPALIQGETEAEWIKSIVYRGDDDQTKLWRSLGPQGIRMLVRALQTPPDEQNETQASLSRDTRMRAAFLLDQLGNDAKSAIPELIVLIKSGETERDQRVRAIEISYLEGPLEKMDDKEKTALFPVLLRALESPDASVRNNTLVALQYYPAQKETVVPLLVKSLQDGSPQVRLRAVTALMKIDPQNAVQADFVAVLVGCVTSPADGFPGAANEAVITLGALHREPDLAVPALIKSLQSGDSYVRQNSAAALGRFGGQAKPAVSALTKALEDSDADVRRHATAALDRINSDAPPR